MHRLVGPNTALFIFITIIGIILASITPNYFGATRILSLSSLIIGEIGLSFIPILALYPKARITQAALLATVYLITAILICFATWAINNLFTSENYAFIQKEGEFYVNLYSLLVANLFSLFVVVLNFRLIYDEELTKESQKKTKKDKYKGSPRFMGFQKSLVRRPVSQEKPLQGKQATKKESFEEDFDKPFEFEPEIAISPETLPEESSGKLFSEKEIKKPPKLSKFFEDEEIITTTTQEKQSFAKPLPPSSIKEDLAAIFEQYSSLDVVKKLTSSRVSTQHESPKKKESEKKSKKPYELPNQTPQISIHVEGEDIHEATFRQITEEEKLREIKEELKKELEDKVSQEKQKIEESVQKTAETKEEIIQSIESVRQELKKELEDKFQAKSAQEILKEEEITEKSLDTKEEIIQSIKNIKEELIESLKEEIKKEIFEKEKEEKEEIEDEEIELLQEITNKINEESNITGSFYLNKKGDVVLENWKEESLLYEGINKTIVELITSLNDEVNKTNQGNLAHLLLKSEGGIIVFANSPNKILTVSSSGTSESDCGQILRALSEIEESYEGIN